MKTESEKKELLSKIDSCLEKLVNDDVSFFCDLKFKLKALKIKNSNSNIF